MSPECFYYELFEQIIVFVLQTIIKNSQSIIHVIVSIISTDKCPDSNDSNNVKIFFNPFLISHWKNNRPDRFPLYTDTDRERESKRRRTGERGEERGPSCTFRKQKEKAVEELKTGGEGRRWGTEGNGRREEWKRSTALWPRCAFCFKLHNTQINRHSSSQSSLLSLLLLLILLLSL